MMATISDIVDVDMPRGPYYGLSALPFVLDKQSTAPTHNYVVSEAEVKISKNEGIEGRGLRTPKYKYHLWSKGEGREQLFDMVNDPGEMRNLAGNPEYAAQLSKHRELFANWLKETDDTYAEK